MNEYQIVQIMTKEAWENYLKLQDRFNSGVPWAELIFVTEEGCPNRMVKNKYSVEDAKIWIRENLSDMAVMETDYRGQDPEHFDPE